MKRLKGLRAKRGQTQQQTAAALGIDRTTYAKYEAGTNEPNIAMIKRMAQHFGVSIDYLLENAQDPAGQVTIEAFGLVGDVRLDALSDAEREKLSDFARYLLAQRSKK